MSLIKEYVETDPSGRKVDETDMLVIKQGFEPAMFTGYFDFWDNEKFLVRIFQTLCDIFQIC